MLYSYIRFIQGELIIYLGLELKRKQDGRARQSLRSQVNRHTLGLAGTQGQCTSPLPLFQMPPL